MPRDIKITEANIDTYKTPEGKEKLKGLSPEDAYAIDVNVWQTYLGSELADPEEQAEHKQRVDILKRIFMTLSSHDLTLKNNDGDQISDSKDLNVAALLSHGGLITVEIPATKEGQDPNVFVNWLLGSQTKANKGAAVDLRGTPVMKRAAATHSLEVLTDEDGERYVQETRPMPKINWGDLAKTASDLHTFTKDFIKDRHMGLNIGLGTEEKAAQENGCNGHLYIYYRPPTEKSPGGLLLGVEGSQPGKDDKFGKKHDGSGGRSEISALGTPKFDILDKRADARTPRIDDGMKIRLNQAQIDSLTQKKADDFQTEILSAKIDTLKQARHQKLRPRATATTSIFTKPSQTSLTHSMPPTISAPSQETNTNTGLDKGRKRH